MQGWKKVNLRREASPGVPADPCDIWFHYRDPVQLLEELYWAAANEEGFAVHPELEFDSVTKERIFSRPNTAEWWHEMQVIG